MSGIMAEHITSVKDLVINMDQAPCPLILLDGRIVETQEDHLGAVKTIFDIDTIEEAITQYGVLHIGYDTGHQGIALRVNLLEGQELSKEQIRILGRLAREADIGFIEVHNLKGHIVSSKKFRSRKELSMAITKLSVKDIP